MTVNEQFKAALKAGKLSEALKIAMAEAVELKITTSVIDPTAPPQSLTTKINLVEGSINNQLNLEFVTKSTHQALQTFHFAQVDQVNETIQQNLNTLTKIFALLTTLQPAQLKAIKTNPAVLITPSVEPQTNFVDTTIKTTAPSTTQTQSNNLIQAATVMPELVTPPVSENEQNKVDDFESENTTTQEVLVPEVLENEQEFDDFTLEEVKNDDQDWGDLLDDLEDEENNNKNNHLKNNNSDDDFE